nr:MAG TPA: hypothetical protein [Caudoviricetes sp.]
MQGYKYCFFVTKFVTKFETKFETDYLSYY